MRRSDPATVLFDLDGTLIDTAPDMAAACNALRAEEGLAPIDAAVVRPHVSRGAAGVLTVGMPSAAPETMEAWRERFLAHYRERLLDSSRPFDGMEEVLGAIEASGRCWGVVTNKPGWLAAPLLEGLDLAVRCCAIVAGDTLPQRKPHPAPLEHAAERCGHPPASCFYVGDDVRDIIASRAAGMASVAALWGYIPPDEDPSAWGARFAAATPLDLLEVLGLTRP